MDSQQLEELETTNQDYDSMWLREACQRCFISLGDIARYQVDLGYSPEHSITFYYQAISLDPNNGWPFNQLAALSESQQNNLDAVYYYLRSIISTKPFPGVEKNIEKLFDKNRLLLKELEDEVDKTGESELKQIKKQLLISKFIQLQALFFASSRTKDAKTKFASSSEISSLCSGVVSILELCLEWDYQEYVEQCSESAEQTKTQLDKQDEQTFCAPSCKPLLDIQLLLKMTALTLLPAYNLRLKGSSDTIAASAFALSIFSLLLQFSHKKIVTILLVFLKESSKHQESLTYEEVLDSEIAMTELLRSATSTNLDASSNEKPLTQPPTQQLESPKLSPKIDTHAKKPSANTIKTSLPGSGKSKLTKQGKDRKATKKKKLIDRRRRKKVKGKGESSSEGSGSESDGSSHSSDASLSPLENLGEDIDLDMIDSLSESSSDSEEDKWKDHKPTDKQTKENPIQCSSLPKSTLKSTGSKSRRQIVLAANFSLSRPGVEKTSIDDEVSIKQEVDTSPVVTTPSAIEDTTQLLDIMQLFSDTQQQDIVYKACLLASGEGYLSCIKVFADWLESYPAVLATYGKMSTTTLWSRLADLVNFLPRESDLLETGLGIDLPKTGSCFNWTQTHAISEDVKLRGFAPLLRIHQNLIFGVDLPPSLQQSIVRIQCLIKFGHYVANSKATAVFSYDSIKGKFIAPVHVEREEAREKRAAQKLKDEKAHVNRSKLMKAMAQQRLQSEVEALTQASAKKKAALFTPYLLPDAPTLCSSLHLVKKLMKTKKFVFVIAKSVIETLDQMKKDRSNYAAREAIKFLEMELQEGNRYLRAQDISETPTPDKRKPNKQDIHVWFFNCLIDCAIYFNCYSGSSSVTPLTGSLATLLLDKPLVKALEIHDVSLDDSKSTKEETNPEIVQLLTTAQQSGVEIETMVRFYQRWQTHQKHTS